MIVRNGASENAQRAPFCLPGKRGALCADEGANHGLYLARNTL